MRSQNGSPDLINLIGKTGSIRAISRFGALVVMDYGIQKSLLRTYWPNNAKFLLNPSFLLAAVFGYLFKHHWALAIDSKTIWVFQKSIIIQQQSTLIAHNHPASVYNPYNSFSSFGSMFVRLITFLPLLLAANGQQLTPTGSPTRTYAPTATFAPTISEEPTLTDEPTDSPTTTFPPTESPTNTFAPTYFPTVTDSPTDTFAPTISEVSTISSSDIEKAIHVR